MGKRKIAETSNNDKVAATAPKSKKAMNKIANAVVKKAFKLSVEHCKSW